MFSIITANWNGEKILPFFLESLINQTYKNFVLYVVDNGSIDKSIDVLESYSHKLKIIIIRLDKNTGFSFANNVGIKLAMSDSNKFIFTLNNDVFLDKYALEIAEKTIISSNGENLNYQITLVNYYKRHLLDATGIKFTRYRLPIQVGFKKEVSNLSQYELVDGPSAGAAIYSKISLILVEENNSYFDNGIFAYFEDADLALRMMKVKIRTRLINKSFAYHMHSFTSGRNSFFKYYNLAKSGRYYFYKHDLFKEFKMFKFYYTYNIFKILIKLLFSLRFKAFRGYFRGVFFGVEK